MSVRLYVEGGGDNKALLTRCQEGFRNFLQQRAEFRGRMPRIIARGSRGSAYDAFCTAVGPRGGSDVAILLVDSEAPVDKGAGAWEHLKARDNWEKPDGASDEQAHLMVQCMESWFLADKTALQNYYGQGFTAGNLPKRTEIEHVSKDDLEKGLKKATAGTTPGEYSKGGHSFQILAAINPDKVAEASPHAKCLLDTLNKLL